MNILVTGATGAVGEALFRRGLCLPSGTQMTEKDLERVVKVAKKCCKY